MKVRPRGPGLQPRQDDVAVRGRGPVPSGCRGSDRVHVARADRLDPPVRGRRRAPGPCRRFAGPERVEAGSGDHWHARDAQSRHRAGHAGARGTRGIAGRLSADAHRYCVSCHNERAKIPAGAPLALEKANLHNPSADADIWEKVVRKIGVGAMPPQGSPTPGAAELTKFAAALAANLDDAPRRRTIPAATCSIA